MSLSLECASSINRGKYCVFTYKFYLLLFCYSILILPIYIIDNMIYSHSIYLEGKRGKNSPFGPRQTPSAKIEHVGVYFAKTDCKIEVGFADIFGVVVRHLGWADGVFCLAFAPWALKSFAAKRKKWR